MCAVRTTVLSQLQLTRDVYVSPVTQLKRRHFLGLPVSTRRILGSHKKIGDKIVLVYSRDALSEPLRRLDEVITQIRIEIPP